jgi:GT2 family glycosyltransferase
MGVAPTLWYGGGYMNWWKGSASVPGFAGPVDSELALLERDVEFASGCALILSREVLVRCGGFDSRYFMYEEDVELSLRIISCGFRIRYAPDSIVRHACQGSLVGQGNEVERGILNPRNPKLPFYVEMIARNRWYTVWKHGGVLNKMQYLIIGTLWWMYRAITFMRNRRSDAVVALVRGWIEGLRSRTIEEVSDGRAA